MAAFDTVRPEPFRADAAPFGAITLYRLIARIDALRLALLDWNERRVTRKALERLSDRELEDIGLSRADLYDPDFLR